MSVKFEDQIGIIPEEPFHLDLKPQLTLDLPPPKKPLITSDFPHETRHERYATPEDKEARYWIAALRPDVFIGNDDPKEILKSIEDSFLTPKVRETAPRQVIVENTLVLNSPKWNRYYKYQEAIKHGRKLTREQIVDWCKMWVQVHPKEVRTSKLKNYQEKLKEAKVQETNRKLDCMIDGIGNTIQEVRHQDRKIQELNVRMRSESMLRRIQESKQPVPNLWHAETKH